MKWFSSTRRLALFDKGYLPFNNATNYFSIGSNTTQTVGNNHWTADEINFTLNVNNAVSKTFTARNTRLRILGNPTSGIFIGHQTYIDNPSGYTGTGGAIWGYFTFVNLERTVDEAIAGIFTAAAGSSGASGTPMIKGIQATAGGSHNGTLQNAIAGEFKYTTSASSPSTTDNAKIIRAFASSQSGVTTTLLQGLSFDGWVNGGGVVTTSCVICVDATVDIGATRHFIKSLSTSPSTFAGDIAVRDTTKGVILTSPDGTCYRFTVANGGALSAGAAVTCP